MCTFGKFSIFHRKYSLGKIQLHIDEPVWYGKIILVVGNVTLMLYGEECFIS